MTRKAHLCFAITLFLSIFQSNAMNTNTTNSMIDIDQNIDDFNNNLFAADCVDVIAVCNNEEVDGVLVERPRIPSFPSDPVLHRTCVLTSSHDANDRFDGMYGGNVNDDIFTDSQTDRVDW